MFKKNMFMLLALMMVVVSVFAVSTAYSKPAEPVSSITDDIIVPLPTIAPSTSVHNINVTKPLYLTDGQTGAAYKLVNGYCNISWQDKTRYGFANAKLTIPDATMKLFYEFQLVAVGNCDDDYIDGIFDIKKNGTVVASGIPGKFYGLSSTPGNYFKFYSNDNTWHFSGYIGSRFDY
ncbi:MAG: hypothetical protein N2645_15975 [Clostridia bacterium]|nr:hypothetical protein [Clostridia bacterium]